MTALQLLLCMCVQSEHNQEIYTLNGVLKCRAKKYGPGSLSVLCGTQPHSSNLCCWSIANIGVDSIYFSKYNIKKHAISLHSNNFILTF